LAGVSRPLGPKTSVDKRLSLIGTNPPVAGKEPELVTITMAVPPAKMPLTDMNPDLDLLERMRMGDAAAMCTLYQRH